MRFTEEHDSLRRTVRDFVKREIQPHVDDWEKVTEGVGALVA